MKKKKKSQGAEEQRTGRMQPAEPGRNSRKTRRGVHVLRVCLWAVGGRPRGVLPFGLITQHDSRARESAGGDAGAGGGGGGRAGGGGGGAVPLSRCLARSWAPRGFGMVRLSTARSEEARTETRTETEAHAYGRPVGGGWQRRLGGGASQSGSCFCDRSGMVLSLLIPVARGGGGPGGGGGPPLLPRVNLRGMW